MSRPSVASYYSEGGPYSPVHSTAENTRRASTAESTDSVPVFFHTPPSAAFARESAARGPSPSSGSHEHVYNTPTTAPTPNAGMPGMTRLADGTGGGRPPRASPPPAAAPSRTTPVAERRAYGEDRIRHEQTAPGAQSPADPLTGGNRNLNTTTLSRTADTSGPAGSTSSTEAAALADSAAFDDLEREARHALESIAIRDEDVEVHMNDYVRTLRHYRDACQARTLYREAHLVEQVLRNLKLEEETRHIRGLTEQQTLERQQLEEVHREEFREFHQAWNARIDEFEESQLEAEIALLERQNDDLLALHEEMRAYNPRALKCDKSTMDARTRQQLLANQRDYRGASKAKSEGDVLEWQQLERAEEERAETYARREATMRQHHLQELNALRMKVESKRLLLEKHRKQELDELLQRYINLRRGMDNQHAIVRGKTETLLLKHAQNPRSNLSGTAAVVESACSGAFGTLVQRRQPDSFTSSTMANSTTVVGGAGGATSSADKMPLADQRRLMDGSRKP